MLDLPADDAPMKEWYFYFRMTKYLPAMPQKFFACMKDLRSADHARRVMTGYVATALDISLNASFSSEGDLVRNLQEIFHLSPAHMTHLDIATIAELIKQPGDQLSQRLTREGFLLENGVITGVKQPAAPQQPRPPRP